MAPRTIHALATSLLTGSLALIACSDDSDPKIEGAKTDAAATTDGAAQSDGAPAIGVDATPTDAPGPDVQLPVGALEECKTKAASNPKPACANCACDNCLAELKACEDDAPCLALRNCAQAKNCCDELCVLTNCFGELNAAGGVQGPSTKRATAVRDCTEKATCNCCGS